jgi:predicted DNA-binding transcriptional regulator YafY
VILQNEKEVQVKIQLYITQELIMTILSYGSNVQVIQPALLKKDIKETIKKMNMMYNS